MGNTQNSQPKIPEEKNSSYSVKEHFADDYPVLSQEGFDLVKLKVDDLFTSDPEKLKRIGERVLEGLSKDNILIIQNSPDFDAKVKAAFNESKKFLSQSQAQKNAFKAEEIEKKRAFYSGYSLIHFDNRDNKRDQEWRDVFQIRYGEEGHIPWPTDEFKTATTQLYESQWAICVQVLHGLALALNISPRDLLTIAVGEGNSSDDIYLSSNTNLCLFHYFDKFMSYKTPQKCMAHHDHGLVTLLPKTDVPGLEFLHPELKKWIPIEQYVDDNDMLLYCGEALAEVTDSLVRPATHRVVRLPHTDRFSMPFEAKPNDNALLKNLVNPAKESNPRTFKDLTLALQWHRIMRQVNRSDGIEPTESDVIKPADETVERPDFGQAHHDVQLPTISVE